MNPRTLFLAASLFTCAASFAATSPVAEGATPTKVADGFRFTEGPAADAEGNVYFTDQPNNRIHRWDAKTGKVEVFLDPAGRSNGLFIAPDGALWACADEKNELWRIDPKTGKHEVIIADFEGKLLNGPNDVWVRPDGGVYFTDPFFKRPYWQRTPEPEQPSRQVYYVAPGTKTATRVTKDLAQPNGVVGSADGKTLYVADPGRKVVLAYDIQPDGSLANKRQFCEGAADGLTLDAEGNLYLAAKGVKIFDKTGAEIGHIDIPEGWTANVTFGGTDGKTLFVTASKSVYTVPMRVKGDGRP